MSIDKIKPKEWDGTRESLEKHIKKPGKVKEGAMDKQVGGDHYKRLAIQPAEYCYKNKLNNLESEAVGYITRHRFKNGKQDIEKAIHTLEMLIQLEYADKS